MLVRRECVLQDIGDVVIGSVLGDSSQRAIQVRIAGFLSGIPENVPVHTVNRCATKRLPREFEHGSFAASKF
jgi:acetyl-CoA acetyltransferase